MQKALDIAKYAAFKAGKIILSGLDKSYEVEWKGKVNAVTEIDKDAEISIKQNLRSVFPDFEILAEESNLDKTNSEYRWIIDPLDGTTNFLHKYPAFCVSIALEYKNEMILGVIYDPLRKETFSVVKGKGVYLNDKVISVSKTDNLGHSILATGIPYEKNDEYLKSFKMFQNVYEKSQGVRRLGSAALDLAYVACGRLDGYWEYHLNPWDVAAGVLMIEEAGGKVTQINGENYSPYIPSLATSNSLIHSELLGILKEEL